MMTAPRLGLLDASFYERPVRLRLPFRFGIVTLTEAPQIFVRARVRLHDGREGEGVAAELLVPKWFDKSPALSNEDNFNQLRRSAAIARRYLMAAGTQAAFGLSAAAEVPHRAACSACGLNDLVASIARSRALREPIHALAREVPVEIDESDADIGAFPRARDLGYQGISAKSCKGFYRALLNRARVEHWNAEKNIKRYFMSAEDLTTQSGVALQQDLALAALIRAGHVERNGHHYVDGMAGAPQHEQDAFLTAHPDLYARATNGRVRLSIQSGAVALGSLDRNPGLAVGVMPDWTAMNSRTARD
jgi:hypothetical protein